MKMVIEGLKETANLRAMEHKSNVAVKSRKEWITIALHVLIWGIVFLIPYIFNANMESGPHKMENDRREFLKLITAMNFLWLALFYLNVSILLLHLVYKRKTGLYIGILAGIICIVIGLDS